MLSENKVSLIHRKNCTDVSVYSNHLPELLEWKWNNGPKDKQNVTVPDWVKKDLSFTRECLRGLLQTDGSIYKDRGYLMINFVNTVPKLSNDVFYMMQQLGYRPNLQELKQGNGKIKHTIRLARDSKKFRFKTRTETYSRTCRWVNNVNSLA